MTHLKEKTSLWNDLTDEQSEKLVGGVGIGPSGGNSAGRFGWGLAGDPSEGHGLCGTEMLVPLVELRGKSGNLVVSVAHGPQPGGCP